jgi:23S rRNA (uridine2552-2'-O)-methyltransferase
MKAPQGAGLRKPVRADGRTAASTRWLTRQQSDPYVAEAKRRGYRSRAAFKLLEIDDRFKLLAPGAIVIDLGAAPGGWTQIALERTQRGGRTGMVIAVDLLEMQSIGGATTLQGDMLAPDLPAKLRLLAQGPVDVVLSDTAPAASGHRETDHLRSLALAEAAHALAREILRPGGSLVVKLFQGGGERDFFIGLGADFAAVRRFKPKSSRAESAELFIVATGFGRNKP